MSFLAGFEKIAGGISEGKIRKAFASRMVGKTDKNSGFLSNLAQGAKSAYREGMNRPVADKLTNKAVSAYKHGDSRSAREAIGKMKQLFPKGKR